MQFLTRGAEMCVAGPRLGRAFGSGAIARRGPVSAC